MKKTRLKYFDEADVLHLLVREDLEASSVEISPNVTAELNEKGELIGIVNASDFLRNAVLDSVQGRLLQLPKAQSS